jgi:FtsZ-binding cell division protein ZapB
MAGGGQANPNSSSPGGEQYNPAAAPGGGNPGGSQPSAGAPNANAQELQELSDLHDKLSSRAQSANDSVETLRRQMTAGGNNLRSDISASQSRMKNYMGKFESALNSGDVDSAKKYMSLAEREVDKLEAFLGH